MYFEVGHNTGRRVTDLKSEVDFVSDDKSLLMNITILKRIKIEEHFRSILKFLMSTV